MATYRYTGITGAGEARKGTVDAENVPAARRKLRGEGVFPAQQERALPRRAVVRDDFDGRTGHRAFDAGFDFFQGLHGELGG